jgi:hypothetical protein
MYDKHFLWMESDSIPIKKGWLQSIEREYDRVAKPCLMPDLQEAAKHDIASAIGVYPPKYLDVLPSDFRKPPWFDYWLLTNRPELVGFTRMIQHRYGIYEDYRVVRRCEFPRDRKILNPEAVIFHADPSQSIIREGLLQAFYHSGDYGDIIAALPIIKQQGGGHLVIGPCHTVNPGKCPRLKMTIERYLMIEPLLQSQSCIRSVRYSPCHEETDKDFSTFRFEPRYDSENLAEWQARHIIGRLHLDQDPWLEVPRSNWTGRVIVSRSPRYHNPDFPWKLISDKYQDQLLFVGYHYEHRNFESMIGRKIEKAITDNLLDVAITISGSRQVFTNQTSIWWIAAGLGKRAVQESWYPELNSVIERKSLRYTRTPEESHHLSSILSRLRPANSI